MNVSELIDILQEHMDEYGDLPVTVSSSVVETTPFIIDAYDKDGNNENERVEIHIHCTSFGV